MSGINRTKPLGDDIEVIAPPGEEEIVVVPKGPLDVPPVRPTTPEEERFSRPTPQPFVPNNRTRKDYRGGDNRRRQGKGPRRGSARFEPKPRTEEVPMPKFGDTTPVDTIQQPQVYNEAKASNSLASIGPYVRWGAQLLSMVITLLGLLTVVTGLWESPLVFGAMIAIAVDALYYLIFSGVLFWKHQWRGGLVRMAAMVFNGFVLVGALVYVVSGLVPHTDLAAITVRVFMGSVLASSFLFEFLVVLYEARRRKIFREEYVYAVFLLVLGGIGVIALVPGHSVFDTIFVELIRVVFVFAFFYGAYDEFLSARRRNLARR